MSYTESGVISRWAVAEPGPIASHPLVQLRETLEGPGAGEVLVRVNVCGVCRTDLHLAEGDLVPRHRHVTPGHEVVGVVEALGEGVVGRALGERVGVAWLASTCGRCRFCRSGEENLCLSPTFTGWDRNGGYASHVAAKAEYVYALPEGFDDEKAAPLLCAGIVGYRALKRAELPPAGRLGIYGFGASAHLAAQVAIAQGATVHVITRSASSRELALQLGATSAGGEFDSPPERLDSAVVFAPAGGVVERALTHLDRGGTLSIAGVHLSDVPSLTYDEHLFLEKRLTSVTANTRQDGEEFLALAQRIPLEVKTTRYSMDRANEALLDLANDRMQGAGVLVNDVA